MGWRRHIHRRRGTRDLGPIKEEKIERKLPDTLLFKRLLQYLTPYKKHLIILTATLVIITLTSSFQPYVSQIMIDKYFNPQLETGLSIPERLEGVIFYTLIFLVLVVIDWLATSGQTFLLS